MEAPAAEFAAMVVGIFITLKAFENVVGGGEADFQGGAGRAARTHPAAAQKQNGCFGIDLTAEDADTLWTASA